MVGAAACSPAASLLASSRRAAVGWPPGTRSREIANAAAVEKTRTVDIIDFVKAEEIDDRFFETPYYLVPSKGGERSYALLREAIRESKRIGIAKFILREAQHLAAVEAIGPAIVLSVMRWP